MKLKSMTCLLFVVLLSRALAWAGVPADPVDDYIAAQMKKHQLPGLSLAVVKDGKVIKAAGYGLANVELGVPATAETVYQWGSVTKMFTSAAVLLLVQDGRLKLDNRLDAHLTNLPPAWQSLTLRQLLNHTSGLKNYTELPGFGREPGRRYTPEELLDPVRNEPLGFEPGTKWAYSNTGYYLLGLVIEKVTGRDWGKFYEERIFRPLEMHTARKNERSLVVTNRASGYDVRSNQWVNAPFTHPSQPAAAGALIGTVLDLAKWDAALYGDQLLNAATRELMWTPTVLLDGSTVDYGLGWQLGSLRGHRQVSHGGAIPGFLSSVFRLPDDKLTVIVLVNGSFDPSGIARAVADLHVPGVLLRSMKPDPDPDPALTARLQNALKQLASGKESNGVTPSFQENFLKSRGRGESLKRRLDEMQSLTYITSEPAPRGKMRYGVPVQRLVHYRMSGTKETRFYTFELTDDGKLASYESSEQ